MADDRTDDKFTFLGQPVRPGQWVSSVMAQVLTAVEQDLWQTWTDQGQPEGGFLAWAGLNEPLIGWRSGHAFHGSGSAVDLNYDQSPYIVTRTGRGTGQILGGEAGTLDAERVRRRAVEVYDRAVSFFTGSGQPANVSIRVRDSIETTYDRFKLVSDALASYLWWAVSAQPVHIERPPIPDVEYLDAWDSAFEAIGGDERPMRPEDAIAQMEQNLYADSDWLALHPDLPGAEELYWQMLRDYEMVRVPMLFGSPAQPVTVTRNPCRGFLPLRRELVCSLVNVGNKVLAGRGRMRWGASDFGPHESGDVMHFDLGGHVGHAPV
ncbi:hypothetical protein ACWCXB_07800 [Streptomyces sp. NPDC001514]